ncbi:MAG: single-stranded DNA-binding protein [Aquiluna sp.]|jgi:single-strand DNA-binding protein
MTEQVCVRGLIATIPRQVVTESGLNVISFRLASSYRKFDQESKTWVTGDTNWFTISAFRKLAINSGVSLAKGDRVIVQGKLRIRDWDNGERSGTSVEIDADAIGHDLSFGTTSFERTAVTEEESEAELQPA